MHARADHLSHSICLVAIMVPRVATQRARERIEPGGDPQFGTLQMETPITAITRNATVNNTMTFRVNFFVANITTCPFRLDLGFGV